MNEAVTELLSDLAAIDLALRQEGFGDTASILARAVNRFAKGAAAIGEPRMIEWPKVAQCLEAQAAKMHAENAALPPAARNTPFGVMTGTATIILSMLSEAIGIGMGAPTQPRIDEVVASLRADRSAHIMARIQNGQPA